MLAPRALLRSSARRCTRRYATASETASNAASKAKDAASETAAKAKDTASNAASKVQSATPSSVSNAAETVKSKASEGLSKVQSSASSAAASASATAKASGGRIARLVSGVQSLIPPTIYYSKVGLEMSKLVFKGQKMSPPTLQQVQASWTPLLQSARNPTQLSQYISSNASVPSPNSVAKSVQNIDRAQLATAGVVVAELLGFFAVGEMLGRMKIVGYRGDTHHHETATPHGN